MSNIDLNAKSVGRMLKMLRLIHVLKLFNLINSSKRRQIARLVANKRKFFRQQSQHHDSLTNSGDLLPNFHLRQMSTRRFATVDPAVTQRQVLQINSQVIVSMRLRTINVINDKTAIVVGCWQNCTSYVGDDHV